MIDHPFIKGLQALYDAHGLPDGITVRIARDRFAELLPFTVTVHDAAGTRHYGHGGTVAEALEKAQAAKAKSDALTRAQKLEMANAILAEIGAAPVSLAVAA